MLANARPSDSEPIGSRVDYRLLNGIVADSVDLKNFESLAYLMMRRGVTVAESLVSSNTESLPYESESYCIMADSVVSLNIKPSPYEGESLLNAADSEVSSNMESLP